jgi:hypothetical protein
MNEQKTRRVPRRTFEAPVGILCRGAYSVERAFQVGEGGMRIGARRKFELDDPVVLTFQIPNGSLVCVLGLVRHSGIGPKNAAIFGIRFENLDNQVRRELRAFVASATQDSIFV